MAVPAQDRLRLERRHHDAARPHHEPADRHHASAPLGRAPPCPLRRPSRNRRLRALGHEAVPASPKSGVDVLTGRGLARALTGAAVVVDVWNSPSFEEAAPMAFFETSSRDLVSGEAEPGVGHHLALSVVGTERILESGYFRAKLAQERRIAESPIPYTIFRATQFF